MWTRFDRRIAQMLALAALLVAVLVLHARRNALRNTAGAQTLRGFVDLGAVWTVGAAVWPLVFHGLVGMRAVCEAPVLLVSLAWPILMLGYDVSTLEHHTREQQAQRVRAGHHSEMSGISSLAFALGSLLMTHMGRQWALAAAPLLSAVIFLCVALILPSPGVHPQSAEAIVIHATKRACVAYCIGLLASAVLLNIHGVHRRQRCVAAAAA